MIYFRSSHRRPATLLKKENQAQVFSCEFCEISKSTFCYRTPPACNFIKKGTLPKVFSCEFCKVSKNSCYRTPPVAASVFCRKKVVAVKIEKLKAFIIKYYDISKTYSVQFHLFYSVNLSYFYFFHGFQSSILHKNIKLLNETK